jgi:hypothetical protein
LTKDGECGEEVVDGGTVKEREAATAAYDVVDGVGRREGDKTRASVECRPVMTDVNREEVGVKVEAVRCHGGGEARDFPKRFGHPHRPRLARVFAGRGQLVPHRSGIHHAWDNDREEELSHIEMGETEGGGGDAREGKGGFGTPFLRYLDVLRKDRVQSRYYDSKEPDTGRRLDGNVADGEGDWVVVLFVAGPKVNTTLFLDLANPVPGRPTFWARLSFAH